MTSFVKQSQLLLTAMSTAFRLRSEGKTQKPSLTLNLRTTTNVRAGGLFARIGSLSGHPSKQQPRSTFLDPVILR
ncbi:hypothetical protein J6590_030182 [Homalodisca vitripennis]|nr:hypothetical protein J6590_030182 [Homalodisca vitripennis]